MDNVLKTQQFKYTGRVQPESGEKDAKGHPLYPYLPSDSLIEAVNLAIYLDRPLLIKGEPGCGKTRLAQAVALELGLPYESWYIKSTSQARDGLYTYDAIGRLRNAQLAAFKDAQPIDDPTKYVHPGPLGRALKNKQRTVILIDEIDKADIDFPNDLLLELDEKRFFIEETGEEIQAEQAPIVFTTSNDEKDLPDAFLRRCLFHNIEFPDMDRLTEIIHAHIPDAPAPLMSAALSRFMKLRHEMKEKGEAGKKVSTSELIDWMRVLQSYPQDEILEKLKGALPFSAVLLKNWDDHQRYIMQSTART